MTLFVIGKPINHSLSPLIHNFWIKKHQIDLEYKKMEVDKDSLPSLIEKVRRKEITGLNVTLPYKKDIIIYIDKNPNISETLFIEDNLIKKNLWSEDTSTLGCLAMWSDDYDMGPDHYVNIQGSGKRDVLCLFLG